MMDRSATRLQAAERSRGAKKRAVAARAARLEGRCAPSRGRGCSAGRGGGARRRRGEAPGRRARPHREN